MGSGYTLKLVKGSRFLDLSVDPYALPVDFIPPAAAEIPIQSRGSGINQFSGDYLTGISYPNAGFSFSLDILGDSVGEVERAYKRLAEFLSQAGDEQDPLFLEWFSQTNVGVAPVWGQWNAPKRFEIVYGTTELSDLYGVSRGFYLPSCSVNMIVKPFILGMPQYVSFSGLGGAAGSGALTEIWYGNSDRELQGLALPPLRYNQFTNPVFGHTTWDNGWTESAGMRANIEYRAGNYLFGVCAARLTSDTSASFFYQSMAVSGTVTVCFYAKCVDGSPVTNSKIRVYHNGVDQTTSVYSLGDSGWYKCVSAAFTHTSGQPTGVTVYAGYEVIVDGFIMDNSSLPPEFGYGDMVGWEWNGTPHASSSTGMSQTGMEIPFGDFLTPTTSDSVGSLCLVWVPSFDSSRLTSGDYQFLSNGNSSPNDWKLYWDADDSKWKFNQWSFNRILSGATSFSAYTPVALHFTWDAAAGECKLYINGTQVGSTGTYDARTAVQKVFLGGGSSSVNVQGYFSGFTIYPKVLTPTQVAADYQNMLPLMEDKKLIDWIPYVWHRYGLPALWSSLETNTPRDNYMIFGGIPGSAPAQLRFDGHISPNNLGQGTDGAGGLFLSRIASPIDIQLGSMFPFYGKLSGTADTDSSEGTCELKSSVSTTAVSFTTAVDMEPVHMSILSGQNIALLTRIKDALGTGLQLRFVYNFGTDASVYATDWIPVDSANKYLIRLTRFSSFKDIRRGASGVGVLRYPSGSGFTLQAKRSAGSGDLRCDWYQIVASPTIRVWSTSSDTDMVRVRYDSKPHEVLSLEGYGTETLVSDLIYVEGTPLELLPNHLNFIVGSQGDIRRELTDISYSDGFLFSDYATITPRWRVI